MKTNIEKQLQEAGLEKDYILENLESFPLKPEAKKVVKAALTTNESFTRFPELLNLPYSHTRASQVFRQSLRTIRLQSKKIYKFTGDINDDTPVLYLPFEKQTCNALYRAKITTLGELKIKAKEPMNILEGVRGLGAVGFEEIIEFLDLRNYNDLTVDHIKPGKALYNSYEEYVIVMNKKSIVLLKLPEFREVLSGSREDILDYAKRANLSITDFNYKRPINGVKDTILSAPNISLRKYNISYSAISRDYTGLRAGYSTDRVSSEMIHFTKETLTHAQISKEVEDLLKIKYPNYRIYINSIDWIQE